MSRKITLWSCIQLLLFLPSCKAPEEPAADRPNFLWISVEDISPRLGCYRDEVARTPVLDRLASEGARFDNAFTTAGVCAPSRSAIITGMYQNSIGTQHMRTTHEAPGLPTPYFAVPPPEVKAFPEYLRKQGYYCTADNLSVPFKRSNSCIVWPRSRYGTGKT